MASRPELGTRRDRLRVIPGQVPDPARFPEGCRFHPRCACAIAPCRVQNPALGMAGDAHLARCLRAAEIAAGTLDPVSGEARRG
jgi:oligopeptide/dipeptide ABC transporter ATP-binding protein